MGTDPLQTWQCHRSVSAAASEQFTDQIPFPSALSSLRTHQHKGQDMHHRCAYDGELMGAFPLEGGISSRAEPVCGLAGGVCR